MALLVTRAQPVERVRQIGYLFSGSQAVLSPKGSFEAFLQALRALGWVEGQNLVIEARFADGKAERLPDLAKDLAARHVDVVVAPSAQTVSVVRHVTPTMAIVMANVHDPVGLGFVKSLPRPGGNITGSAAGIETTTAKHFELLSAVKPGIERVGVLYNPDNAGSASGLKYHQEQAAPRLGLVVVPIPVSKPADFDEAFALIARERITSLCCAPTVLISIANAPEELRAGVARRRGRGPTERGIVPAPTVEPEARQRAERVEREVAWRELVVVVVLPLDAEEQRFGEDRRCDRSVRAFPAAGIEQRCTSAREHHRRPRVTELVGAARVAGDAEKLERLAPGPQLARELGAPHERHPHVGEEQVDGVAVLVEHLHGFLAVPRLVHAVARARECEAEQLPDRGFVLDQQDSLALVASQAA